jgi:hypothetical protein
MKKETMGQVQRPVSVTLATREVEIKKIMV